MFTGLIQGKGKIKEVDRRSGDVRLTVVPLFEIPDCHPGESISVDGVCLTVTDIKQGRIVMDASEETLVRSTLRSIKQGDEVNLERALRLIDRLGGHLVLGHVDGTGRIVKMEPRHRSWVVRIEVGDEISRYLVEKGSVAMDGVSLTINRCGPGYFEVNIIPKTWEETTLINKRAGDFVNIETDIIGKYVERFAAGDAFDGEEARPSGIDREFLLEHGFGE